MLRKPVKSARKVSARAAICGDLLKAPRLPLPIVEIGRGGFVMDAALHDSCLIKSDKAARIAIGQRVEQNRFHSGENRGVCTDAECEDNEARRSKRRVLMKGSKAITDVLPECHGNSWCFDLQSYRLSAKAHKWVTRSRENS